MLVTRESGIPVDFRLWQLGGSELRVCALETPRESCDFQGHCATHSVLSRLGLQVHGEQDAPDRRWLRRLLVRGRASRAPSRRGTFGHGPCAMQHGHMREPRPSSHFGGACQLNSQALSSQSTHRGGSKHVSLLHSDWAIAQPHHAAGSSSMLTGQKGAGMRLRYSNRQVRPPMTHPRQTWHL